jgi:hypothetical protein
VAKSKFIRLRRVAFVCGVQFLLYGGLVLCYGEEGRLGDGVSILGYIKNMFAGSYRFTWSFSDLNNIGIILLYSPEVWFPYSSVLTNMCLLFVGSYYFLKSSALLGIRFTYACAILFVNSYVFYASLTPNKEAIAFALYAMIAFYFIKGQFRKSVLTALVLVAIRPIHSWIFVVLLGLKHPKRAIALAFLFGMCFRYWTVTGGVSIAFNDFSNSFIESRKIHYALYSGTYSADMIFRMLGIQLSGFVLNVGEFLYNIIANVIGGFSTLRILLSGSRDYEPGLVAHFVQFVGNLFFFALLCIAALARRIRLSKRIACLSLVPLFFISANPFPHARYYFPFMPIFMLWAISFVANVSTARRDSSQFATDPVWRRVAYG